MVSDSTTRNRGRPCNPAVNHSYNTRRPQSARPSETSDDWEIFVAGFKRLLPSPLLPEEVLFKPKSSSFHFGWYLALTCLSLASGSTYLASEGKV